MFQQPGLGWCPIAARSVVSLHGLLYSLRSGVVTRRVDTFHIEHNRARFSPERSAQQNMDKARLQGPAPWGADPAALSSEKGSPYRRVIGTGNAASLSGKSGKVRGCCAYCSFAYSALACFRMGMSGSASFQRAKKSWYAACAFVLSPARAYAQPVPSEPMLPSYNSRRSRDG